MARYLVTFLPGNPIPTRTKWIDDAVGPPDADVDAGTDGVSFGSILWDGTDLWFCVDAATGAAVWVQLGGGGGSGDLEDLETDLTVSGSYTVDRDDAPNHDLTLTGNTVLDATSTTYTAGLLSMLLLIRQDGTGGRTLDMSAFTWTDGEPTMPSAPNALLIVPIFSWDNGASWMGITPGGGGADAPTGHYELLMTGSPPEPLEDGTGTDWLYVWVNG